MSFDLKISDGDISIGSDGDFEKIERTEKLIQDIVKMLITPLGSNQFYRWYGSPLSKSMIGNVFSFEFLSSVASNQISNSLDTLQRLQQEQAKRQKVTPFEHMAAIKNVRTERNQVDPRHFVVAVSILTRALTEATTYINISPTTL